MYLRKLLLLIGVVSLLLAGRAYALGLGDIELNSALNQPLDAQVSLLDVGPLDDSQIIVNLASPEDFQRAGLERPFFYNQLRFNVVTESPDGPFIAITTREPVREPYLSFIIEVRWSSGRLLREYTLLLDLPVFSGEEARAVQSTGTGTTSPQAKTEPVQRAEPSRPAVSATPSAGRTGSTYGPVATNETLWEIAMQVRPSGASIQQTMLAIQRANPEAFINNNINLLRRGQVLRIPADADIRSMTARQAISEVAAQNRQWSGNAMGAQLDASGRSARVDRASGEVSGRVRLAGGGNGRADDAATGSGQSGNDGQALEEELAATRDELRRAQGESSELRDRVRELEGQIETMESLLEATNEQMRALELAAAAAEDGDAGETDTATPAGGDPEMGEVPDTDSTMAGEEDLAADEQTTSPVTDEPAAAVDETAAETAVEERPVNRVVRREPPPKTLMDHLMENLLWVVAGVAALLLLVVLLLRRRQDANTGDDEEMTDEDSFPEPGFSMDEDSAALEEDTEDDVLALDLDEEDSAQEETPARAETGDVVGEADIYIRLGKYDQAEEMLHRGLEDEPGSEAIQLKLLELYVESDNLEAFDSRYGQLLQTADAETAARARDLRAQFANAPAFDEPDMAETLDVSTDTSAASDSEGLDFDLDLDSDTTDTTGEDELSLSSFEDEEEQPAADSFDLDDDFTFDLDDELSDTEESAPATSDLDLESSSSSDYDLSFDEDDSDTAGKDDELLDFDFDLGDDSDSAKADTDEDKTFSIDLDSEDDLTLDTEDTVGSDDKDTGDEDFTFSLDDDESDTGLELSDELTKEDSDDTLSLEESEGEMDTVASDSLTLDDDEEVPTLDLADDEADDFDLDSAMGDVDIDALDREMSDLDADVDAGPETSTASDEDDTFEQALATSDEGEDDLALDDLPTPEESNSAGEDEPLDDDMDFMADADEAATKLDLARAYIDMGDMEGARDILAEVAEEGNDEQRSEAQSLLERVES